MKNSHEDMISSILIIKPKLLAKAEGKYKTTHKFVTGGYSSRFNIKIIQLERMESLNFLVLMENVKQV